MPPVRTFARHEKTRRDFWQCRPEGGRKVAHAIFFPPDPLSRTVTRARWTWQKQRRRIGDALQKWRDRRFRGAYPSAVHPEETAVSLFCKARQDKSGILTGPSIPRMVTLKPLRFKSPQGCPTAAPSATSLPLGSGNAQHDFPHALFRQGRYALKYQGEMIYYPADGNDSAESP